MDDDNTYCLRQGFQEQVLKQRLASRRFIGSAQRPLLQKSKGQEFILYSQHLVMLELNPSYRTRGQEVRLGGGGRQDLMGTLSCGESSALFKQQEAGRVLFIIVRGHPLLQAQRVWGVRSFKIEGGAEINPDVLGWKFPLLWSSAVLN